MSINFKIDMMKKLLVSTALLAVALVSANAQEADRFVGPS